MRYLAILIGFSVCAGCENGLDALRTGDSAAGQAPSAVEHIVNRVWTQADSAGLPGVMRIFLADGTLVQDSCWETHRLSLWRLDLGGALVWDEDGSSIKADIVSSSERELVLRLHLARGSEEQRYTAASAPYVCPDLPR